MLEGGKGYGRKGKQSRGKGTGNAGQGSDISRASRGGCLPVQRKQRLEDPEKVTVKISILVPVQR